MDQNLYLKIIFHVQLKCDAFSSLPKSSSVVPKTKKSHDGVALMLWNMSCYTTKNKHSFVRLSCTHTHIYGASAVYSLTGAQNKKNPKKGHFTPTVFKMFDKTTIEENLRAFSRWDN